MISTVFTQPGAWRKAGAALALLTLFFVTPGRTQGGTPAAPGAGGYNSEFGTDYGVGKARRASGREPVVAIGFKGKTPNGAIPWVGLRFAELLSDRLQPLMGPTTPSGGLSRFLAARGLRAQDMACPAEGTDILTIPALVQLRADSGWKKRSDILVFGEVLVKGVSSTASPVAQADALMRDGTSLTVRVRALRNRPQSLVVASGIVVVQAPGREWAQLPARVALALLDDMRVTLTEDERTDLLRDASPLLTSASQLRVRSEGRLGAAIARALDAQVLNYKAGKAPTAAQKTLLARQALAAGQSALRELKELVKRPAAATIRDGDIFAYINVSARNWTSYTEAVLTSARRNLKSR